MILLAAAAFAEPWSDPTEAAARECVRVERIDAFVGDGRWEPWERAAKLAAPCDADLSVAERGRGTWRPGGGLEERLRIAVGNAVPDNLSGDEEPGLLTTVVAVDGVGYLGPFVLAATPELALDVVPGATVTPRFATLYGGVAWRGVSAGFGRRDRWMGPGRHSALLLSDNARPPWLGSAAVDGRLPGWFDRLGRFRIEAGAGWMDQPRTDVTAPGLLMMDVRWMLVPGLEIGADRLSIFGGVGRPPVDVGQLLLPTEPHVYDDPDLTLPDQDELASLDVRVNLPVGKWLGLPIDYVEGWWQYGGEDVIGKKLGPIPYPSLAGVGNLYGGAVGAGPIVGTVEYTALLDDYFRWYVGHRVYHEGFTQLGRPLGQFAGTDAETLFASVSWTEERARARLWGDTVRRIGVIEALNDHVFALTTEEHRQRLGVDGAVRFEPVGWIGLGYTIEHLEGANFVPGAEEVRHRVAVTVRHEGPAGRW